MDPHSPFEMQEGSELPKKHDNQQRSPLTMAMLFYFVTLGAIVSACLRLLVGEEAATQESVFRVIGLGIAMGCMVGGLVGIFYFKNMKSAVIGTLVGGFVGALAGGLALVRGDRFTEIVSIAFGGCFLLILVMLTAARLGRSSLA